MFTYHPIVAFSIKFTKRLNQTIAREYSEDPISAVSMRINNVTVLGSERNSFDEQFDIF